MGQRGRPTKNGPSVHQGFRIPQGLLDRINAARGPRTLTDAILDALHATYDPPPTFNENSYSVRAVNDDSLRLPERVG